MLKILQGPNPAAASISRCHQLYRALWKQAEHAAEWHTIQSLPMLRDLLMWQAPMERWYMCHRGAYGSSSRERDSVCHLTGWLTSGAESSIQICSFSSMVVFVQSHGFCGANAMSLSTWTVPTFTAGRHRWWGKGRGGVIFCMHLLPCLHHWHSTLILLIATLLPPAHSWEARSIWASSATWRLCVYSSPHQRGQYAVLSSVGDPSLMVVLTPLSHWEDEALNNLLIFLATWVPHSRSQMVKSLSFPGKDTWPNKEEYIIVSEMLNNWLMNLSLKL